MEKKIKPKKQCRQCKKRFAPNHKQQRFCTNSCAATYRSKKNGVAAAQRLKLYWDQRWAKKPHHRRCQQCREWFQIKRRENPRKPQRFCTISCSAIYRSAQPAWKKRQSEMMKARSDPEVMRERSRALWHDPKYAEVRDLMLQGAKKYAQSERHRAFMRRHNEKLWKNKDFRARMIKAGKEATKKKWQDPEYRAMHSELRARLNRERGADPVAQAKINLAISKSFFRSPKFLDQMARLQRQAQTPEAKARARNRLLEFWQDPVKREQMRKRSRETIRKNWENPAFRTAAKAATHRYFKNPANREKVGERNRRLWADPAYRAHRKALWTPEKAAEQSERNRKLWADPEFKARVSARIAAAKNTPEYKKAVSKLSKSRWADPEFRERVITKMREAYKSNRKG